MQGKATAMPAPPVPPKAPPHIMLVFSMALAQYDSSILRLRLRRMCSQIADDIRDADAEKQTAMSLLFGAPVANVHVGSDYGSYSYYGRATTSFKVFFTVVGHGYAHNANDVEVNRERLSVLKSLFPSLAKAVIDVF